MDRVVVSHDWLGRNFENFLRTQDAQGDFRRLLKSVTAVVLGTQVRPSFYYALTGAIYLDGDNFWLSPEERDTVNEAPDFRSDFGSALQYSDMWRYVQNNLSIFVAFNPRSRLTRDVAYLLNESGWLMYHELGHAQDFLPSSQYAGLNAALDPWGNIGPRYANRQLMSDSLRINFGLASSEMNGLAQVKFIGATANDTQRGYTPDQVLERAHVPVLEHRAAAACAPGDQIVELAAIDLLPATVQRLTHLGSQFVIHGPSSCGDVEQMCSTRG